MAIARKVEKDFRTDFRTRGIIYQKYGFFHAARPEVEQITSHESD